MNWKQAVLQSLRSLSNRKQSRLITRQELLAEELENMIAATSARGETPSQTLSRVLQELREERKLAFLGDGRYFLLDSYVLAEAEDLPDEAIDLAVQSNKLQFGQVDTDNRLALTRQRQGQNRVRALTLHNYNTHCALCDVNVPDLLVASHIVRWSDEPSVRGDLSNVICLCRFHDPLFELGYLALSDDYQVLTKNTTDSCMIEQVLKAAHTFSQPQAFTPAVEYLRKHRQRTGF